MKPAYFGRDVGAGVDIAFIRAHQTIVIGGWYDHMVGIEAETLSLREFFARVGITERDCRKAFRTHSAEAHKEDA